MIPRSILAALALASSVMAAPSLTTIQDVLYKADGTRFNGVLTISWNSFQSADNTAVVTQSSTVKVMDGNLRVQLVPGADSTPPAYYTVTYNSDGRVQFQETWAVPASTRPLQVKDVRIATRQPGTSTGSDTGSTTGPVQESDVVGLISDLGVRPVKGPGYAAGRVAIVNATGALESVSGNPSDCVRVDGSSGPCGEEAATFVDGDSLSGIVDGANPSFFLSALPNPASSLSLYRNGVLQKMGQDYTVSGNSVQFIAEAVPQPGDTLLASYRLSGGDGTSTAQHFPAPQVLCSGTGAATNAADWAGLATCTIAAGLLTPGDRVEIRFDVEHQGSGSGFSFEIRWGSTTLLHRDAGAGDQFMAGRVDASISAVNAQVSTQSWGTVLPFAAGVGSAADAYTNGLNIAFQGKPGIAGDVVTLRNYAVVRTP